MDDDSLDACDKTLSLEWEFTKLMHDDPLNYFIDCFLTALDLHVSFCSQGIDSECFVNPDCQRLIHRIKKVKSNLDGLNHLTKYQKIELDYLAH